MSFLFDVGTVGVEGNPVAGAFVSLSVSTHLDKPKDKGFTLLCFIKQESFTNNPIGQGALSITLDIILIDVCHSQTLPIQQVFLHDSLLPFWFRDALLYLTTSVCSRSRDVDACLSTFWAELSREKDTRREYPTLLALKKARKTPLHRDDSILHPPARISCSCSLRERSTWFSLYRLFNCSASGISMPSLLAIARMKAPPAKATIPTSSG